MVSKQKNKGYVKKESSKSVASIVVDRLIEKIDGAKNSRMPWQMPYKGGCINWYSERPYKGINLFLLFGGSGEYITFKQLKEYNDKVKGDYQIIKGTRSDLVLFTQVTKKQVSESYANDLISKGYGKYLQKDENGNYFKVQFTWKYYNVFDIRKIVNSKGESLPSKLKQNVDTKEHKKAEEVIDKYVGNTGIKLTENNATTPYYTHVGDYVNMPSKDRFKNNASYFSTYFHELVHSTGIKTRLNRKCYYEYHESRQERSREELIAEVGASLLMAECDENLDEVIFENSLNYVSGWCSWMAVNPEEVLRGMMDAEKGVEFILEGGKKKEKVVPEVKETIKKVKTIEETLKDLLEASHNNNQRGKRTWDRLVKSGKHEEFINNPNSKESPFKLKLEKIINGEPLLSIELQSNMKLFCGMTFAVIVNEKGEHKLIYSIERGDTLEDASHKAGQLKISSLQKLTEYMNLRRKIV